MLANRLLFLGAVLSVLPLSACRVSGNGAGYEGVSTPVTAADPVDAPPIQQEIPDLPYIEEFDSGQLPARWSHQDGFWSLDNVNGVLIQSAYRGPTTASFGDSNWSSYSIEAKLKLGITDSNRAIVPSVGVVGRFRDKNNFYFIEYATILHRLRIIKVVNKIENVLAEGPAEIEADSWFNLHVEFIGSRIVATLNDDFVLDAKDSSSPFLTGAVGLRSKHQAFFTDNYTVDAVDSKLLRHGHHSQK